MKIFESELKNLIDQTRLYIKHELGAVKEVQIASENKAFFDTKIILKPKAKELAPAHPLKKSFTPTPPGPGSFHKVEKPQFSKQTPPSEEKKTATPKPSNAIKIDLAKAVKTFELSPFPAPIPMDTQPWINLFQKQFPQTSILKDPPDKFTVSPPKFLLITSGDSSFQKFISHIHKTLSLYSSDVVTLSCASLKKTSFSACPPFFIVSEEIYSQQQELFKSYSESRFIKIESQNSFKEISQKKQLWQHLKPQLS